MEDDTTLSAIDKLRAEFDKLAATSAHLTSAQSRASFTLADVISSFTHERANQFIIDNPQETLLFQYMNDGWSCWISSHKNFTDASGTHRVQSKHRAEFCLERAILRNCSGSDSSVIFMMFGIPRPMLLGKCTSNFFQAMLDFTKHPRMLGHKGILNELYIFDGLHHDPLLKCFPHGAGVIVD